jgi:hypothetical protein
MVVLGFVLVRQAWQCPACGGRMVENMQGIRAHLQGCAAHKPPAGAVPPAGAAEFAGAGEGGARGGCAVGGWGVGVGVVVPRRCRHPAPQQQPQQEQRAERAGSRGRFGAAVAGRRTVEKKKRAAEEKLVRGGAGGAPWEMHRATHAPRTGVRGRPGGHAPPTIYYHQIAYYLLPVTRCDLNRARPRFK